MTCITSEAAFHLYILAIFSRGSSNRGYTSMKFAGWIPLWCSVLLGVHSLPQDPPDFELDATMSFLENHNILKELQSNLTGIQPLSRGGSVPRNLITLFTYLTIQQRRPMAQISLQGTQSSIFGLPPQLSSLHRTRG